MCTSTWHCTLQVKLAFRGLVSTLGDQVFSFHAIPGVVRRVICPRCHTDSPRRSHRRHLTDHIGTLAGLRPWRCKTCDLRFYAWSVPVKFITYTHCGLCGNMDLQRISSEYGTGTWAWLFRLLRVPTYRCELCRHRFFSLRKHSRIVAQHIEYK